MSFALPWPIVVPELRQFEVVLRNRRGEQFPVVVEAEGERLAILLAERLNRGTRGVTVNGVAVLGRCVRCRGLLLEGDWHRRFPIGLVCEDCPR